MGFSSYFSVPCPYHKCCIDQPSEYSLLSNKLRISDVFHKMNSPIKYVCFAGALYNNFILKNWIFFSAENALTLAEWLSVTILVVLSPISMRLSMLSLIFSASHYPLNVTSGLAWLGCGMAWTRKVWTVLMELPETQQLLCTHFLLCLLSDTEAVYQKFTTDLHIYWPLPKTQESDFCRAL